MASNLACIGLDVAGRDEFDALVEETLPSARSLGHSGRVEVLRWQDPSGARLIFEVRGGAVEGVMPSYEALPGARLAAVERVTDAVATASVVDDTGEQITAIAVEFEERRLWLGKRDVLAGSASIVGLGVGVQFFEDAEAFAASAESLLHASGESPDPPPHVVEFGLPWPPRMAAESLIAYGTFAEPHDVDAYARLYGTVLGASERTCALTGQRFHAVRTRTVGFDLEICVQASAHPELPRTGQVIGGMVFLVGSLGDDAKPKHRLHLPGRG